MLVMSGLSAWFLILIGCALDDPWPELSSHTEDNCSQDCPSIFIWAAWHIVDTAGTLSLRASSSCAVFKKEMLTALCDLSLIRILQDNRRFKKLKSSFRMLHTMARDGVSAGARQEAQFNQRRFLSFGFTKEQPAAKLYGDFQSRKK